MKYIYTLSFVLTILLLGCKTTVHLRIATAANMRFAMEEIASEFEKEYQIKVELIVSSSGKLTSQIEQGAPFDVFVSADMKYPKYLYDHNYTTGMHPVEYAQGKAMLWSMHIPNPTLEILTDSLIKKIAIPNPKTAPYGKSIVDYLKTKGIYNSIKHKLVFGESVSQCNQFITTNAGDIGVTALSSIYAPALKEKGHWKIIEDTDFKNISQGLVILKNSKQQSNAKLFFEFMLSPKGKNILRKYSYLVPSK